MIPVYDSLFQKVKRFTIMSAIQSTCVKRINESKVKGSNFEIKKNK